MSDEDKSDYDRREMKIVRRGVSLDKVVAVYRHFGSLRKTGQVCGIAKDTVAAVLRRRGIELVQTVALPQNPSHSPKRKYSTFAKWHVEHIHDSDIPNSVSAIAKLAGVSADTVKCYFYRRRRAAAKILGALPNLRHLDLVLEDIEGKTFETKYLVDYKYIVDWNSERAAIQGRVTFPDPAYEATALIPSIEQFAARVRAISASARLSAPKKPSTSRPEKPQRQTPAHSDIGESPESH